MEQTQKKPLISIIIPHYNRGNLIMATLWSIFKQDYKNYEIIIIDDKSTSGKSLLELKEIKKNYPFIKIIYLKKNYGPAKARNEGIFIAKGEYIFCLDSDDKIYKKTLEKSIEILINKNEIGFVYTHTRYTGNKNYIAKRPKFNFQRLLIYDYIVISSLFKKTGWEKVKGFDENKQLEVEDWEFWINMSKNGYKGELLDYIGCEILLHNNTYSSIARQNLNKTLKYIQKKHKDLYKNNEIIYLEYLIPSIFRKPYVKILNFIPMEVKYNIQKILGKTVGFFKK